MQQYAQTSPANTVSRSVVDTLRRKNVEIRRTGQQQQNSGRKTEHAYEWLNDESDKYVKRSMLERKELSLVT